MTATLISFLLTWLLLWAAMCLISSAGLCAIDYVAELWKQHQRARRRRQAHLAELALINQEAAASIQRMAVGFALAQRRIRDEIVRTEEVRR